MYIPRFRRDVAIWLLISMVFTTIHAYDRNVNQSAYISRAATSAELNNSLAYQNKLSQRLTAKSSVLSASFDSSHSLNWASHNNPLGVSVMPPVVNQGLCGACWAFVAAAAVDASVFIKTNRRVQVSVQELLDCDRMVNKGCLGGDPSNAFRYIVSNGIALTNNYPYTEKDGKCIALDTYQQERSRVYISGVVHVDPYNEDSLIKSLLTLGPVATGICGTDSAFLYYQSGVFNNPNCCKELNHAVLIVGYGYDIKYDLNYWILQNSWGPLWGENGFMRIARIGGYGPGLCGIDTVPSIPFGPYIKDNIPNPPATQPYNASNAASHDHEHDQLNYILDAILNWLAVHWRSVAALFSSVLLTCSVLLLLYSVYLDHHINQRHSEINC